MHLIPATFSLAFSSYFERVGLNFICAFMFYRFMTMNANGKITGIRRNCLYSCLADNTGQGLDYAAQGWHQFHFPVLKETASATGKPNSNYRRIFHTESFTSKKTPLKKVENDLSQFQKFFLITGPESFRRST